MATVTLDSSVVPSIQLLATDANPDSPLPRAKLNFRSPLVTPIVGAGDVLVISGSFLLPPNFAYLTVSLLALTQFTGALEAAKPQPAIAYNFISNGLTTHEGYLLNQAMFAGATPTAVEATNPSVTNNFFTYYTILPGDRVFKEVVGSLGAVSFETVLVNSDAAGTEAGIFIQEYTFFQFTIEQARRSKIHWFADMF